MKIGTTELIVILVIALLVFGPQKLPEMAKTLGQTLGGFKKELVNYEEDAEEIKDALSMDAAPKKKKKSSSKKKAAKVQEPDPEEDEEAEEEAEEAPAEAPAAETEEV